MGTKADSPLRGSEELHPHSHCGKARGCRPHSQARLTAQCWAAPLTTKQRRPVTSRCPEPFQGHVNQEAPHLHEGGDLHLSPATQWTPETEVWAEPAT